jgi:hypothetical protein
MFLNTYQKPVINKKNEKLINFLFALLITGFGFTLILASLLFSSENNILFNILFIFSLLLMSGFAYIVKIYISRLFYIKKHKIYSNILKDHYYSYERCDNVNISFYKNKLHNETEAAYHNHINYDKGYFSLGKEIAKNGGLSNYNSQSKPNILKLIAEKTKTQLMAKKIKKFN